MKTLDTNPARSVSCASRIALRMQVALIVLMLAACSKPAGSNVNSCTASQDNLCSEWTGLTPSELKDAILSCAADGKSKFAAGPCPKEGAIASCMHPKDKIKLLHYRGALKVSTLKEMCTSEKGEFTTLGN